MIFFKLTGNDHLYLQGISREKVSRMQDSEVKKLITDEITEANFSSVLTGSDYIYVVVNDFKDLPPFRIRIKIFDYVKAAESKYWENGTYTGKVKLMKKGTAVFIKPIIE